MLELDLRALARNWWMLLIRGILAVLFGVLAILWPGVTVTVLVIMFGAFALVDGAFAIGAALFRLEDGSPRWLLVVEGLLGLAIGVVAMAWPSLTAVTLLYFIAAWAIITGLFEIIGAVSLRRQIENEWLLGISGILSVFLGVVLIAFPIAALTTIAIVAGIFAIFFGALMIGLSFRLRGLAKSSEEYGLAG